MDIVERLNEMIGKGEYYEPEYEQAKAEIERLREALRKIADTDPEEGTDWFHAVANAALQQKDTE